MSQETKKPTRRVLSGTVLLTPDEREALKKCAANNARKMPDQMRWYIREGLVRDGYMKE